MGWVTSTNNFLVFFENGGKLTNLMIDYIGIAWHYKPLQLLENNSPYVVRCSRLVSISLIYTMQIKPLNELVRLAYGSKLSQHIF